MWHECYVISRIEVKTKTKILEKINENREFKRKTTTNKQYKLKLLR